MLLALFGFVRLGLFGSVKVLLIAASRVRMIEYSYLWVAFLILARNQVGYAISFQMQSCL